MAEDRPLSFPLSALSLRCYSTVAISSGGVSGTVRAFALVEVLLAQFERLLLEVSIALAAFCG